MKAVPLILSQLITLIGQNLRSPGPSDTPKWYSHLSTVPMTVNDFKNVRPDFCIDRTLLGDLAETIPNPTEESLPAFLQEPIWESPGVLQTDRDASGSPWPQFSRLM